MKVYLLKSIEKVGIAGEILNVSQGYAQNYLFPRKLAMQVTDSNQAFFEKRAKTIENRKEAIATETSMLSEKIQGMSIILHKKMHDDDRLYAAVSQNDVADALAAQQIKVSKSQIIFDKAIKSAGTFEVTVKLSSKLQPKIHVKVVRLTEK